MSLSPVFTQLWSDYVNEHFLPWCVDAAMANLLAAKYAINYKIADRQSAVERMPEMCGTWLLRYRFRLLKKVSFQFSAVA